ncbi:unnamed protein product, partial [Didymodactylos carnosus]
MNYAAEYHYTPFKSECQPKLNDKKDGVKLINDLIKYIKVDFTTQNPMFSKPLLVDLWWIDPQGNVQMVIKTTELYVYLCKQERYPKTLNNTTIIPHLPAHLPPQHIALIKYVKNLVTNDDVKDELNSRFESVFAIDSMSGATNQRSRHVKIEFLQKNEIDSLLNS